MVLQHQGKESFTKRDDGAVGGREGRMNLHGGCSRCGRRTWRTSSWQRVYKTEKVGNLPSSNALLKPRQPPPLIAPFLTTPPLSCRCARPHRTCFVSVSLLSSNADPFPPPDKLRVAIHRRGPKIPSQQPCVGRFLDSKVVW